MAGWERRERNRHGHRKALPGLVGRMPSFDELGAERGLRDEGEAYARKLKEVASP
jgi:hypothetical protein